MTTIALIVEGHGEVEALPLLLRRIAAQVGRVVNAPRPFRIRRQNVLKAGEIERSVEFVANRAGVNGKILILLDANSDCPKTLAAEIVNRARQERSDRPIQVVLAKMEYEAWFLAAAESVAGRGGIKLDVVSPSDPEAIRNAKGWIRKRMKPGRSYSPSTDQAALTAVFDMDAARKRSPSFDKLYRAVVSLLVD